MESSAYPRHQLKENNPKAVDVTLVSEEVADEAPGVELAKGSLDEHDELAFLHGLELEICNLGVTLIVQQNVGRSAISVQDHARCR